MIKFFYLSIGVLFAFGLCPACIGQCTDGFTVMHFHCAGPGGCEADVYPYIPEESEYGVLIQPNPLNCCGQIFSSWDGNGFCNPGMVRKAGVKQAITRAAATSDVLVADCKGRYVPYDPSRINAPDDRRVTLADERVLR